MRGRVRLVVVRTVMLGVDRVVGRVDRVGMAAGPAVAMWVTIEVDIRAE